ncbi:hypothetical protein [Kutzneria chonburiensis]|uniref:Transmembrane protein n=1 Tax=Kutzneria chonburiensis TaxID=1483604 RepID=A0ABV6MR23_9PSEU|nr:hypothetical protein [Kutzneria chonburiensis]
MEVEPEDAARALDEIRLRREQVLTRKVIPAWHWWGHAALIVMLSACIETGGVFVWVGVGVFMAVGLAIDLPVRRRARAAAPRRSLAGPGSGWRTLLALLTFLVVVLGVCLATGLTLKAFGVPYPGTIAATVGALVFAVAGQLLVRYEQTMLVRLSRGRG